MAFAVNCRRGGTGSVHPLDSDATTIVARPGASAIKSAILIRAISRMAAKNKCLAESNKSPDGPVATKKRAANR